MQYFPGVKVVGSSFIFKVSEEFPQKQKNVSVLCKGNLVSKLLSKPGGDEEFLKPTHCIAISTSSARN